MREEDVDLARRAGGSERPSGRMPLPPSRITSRPSAVSTATQVVLPPYRTVAGQARERAPATPDRRIHGAHPTVATAMKHRWATTIASSPMAASVICISRALGAGGEDVARLVSERLGFVYVDEEIIARAAERSGIDHEIVADEERRKSLIASLLSAMADGGAALRDTSDRRNLDYALERRRAVVHPRRDRGSGGQGQRGDRRACRLTRPPARWARYGSGSPRPRRRVRRDSRRRTASTARRRRRRSRAPTRRAPTT